MFSVLLFKRFVDKVHIPVHFKHPKFSFIVLYLLHTFSICVSQQRNKIQVELKPAGLEYKQ